MAWYDYTPLGAAINAGRKAAGGDVRGAAGAAAKGTPIGAAVSLGGKAWDEYGDEILDATGLAKTNTTGLQADIAQNREVTAGLKSSLDTLQPRGVNGIPTPQQVQRPAFVPTSQAAAPGVVNAPVVGAPAPVVAGTVAPRQAAGVSAGPAAQAVMSGAGPTLTSATGIATGASDQVRAGQMGLAGSYESVLSGGAPTAAQARLRQGFDQMSREVGGLVGQARGTERQGARLSAMLQAGDQGRALANDSAALEAQEQATARQGLGGLLGQTRATDVGLATDQARLTQGSKDLNAQLGTNVSLANSQEFGTTSRFNTGETNAMQEFDTGLASDLEKFNTGLGARADEFNTGNKLEADKFTTEIGTRVGTADADRTYRAASDSADRGNRTDIFNTGEKNAQERFRSAQDVDVDKFNTRTELDARVAQIDNELRARGLDDAQRAQYMDAFLRSQSGTLDASMGLIGIRERDAQRRREFFGGGAETAGSLMTLIAGA